MIEAYSTALSVASSSGPIPFSNKMTRGRSVVLDDDNKTFKFNLPGVYKVDVSVTGNVTAGGILSAQIYADGNPVARAQAQAVTGAAENQNIAFSTLLTVSPTMLGERATMTLNYGGGAGTLLLADVIITRVG